VDYPVDCSIVS